MANSHFEQILRNLISKRLVFVENEVVYSCAPQSTQQVQEEEEKEEDKTAECWKIDRLKTAVVLKLSLLTSLIAKFLSL